MREENEKNSRKMAEKHVVRAQAVDTLRPSSTCSEDRKKSFERGIYPPLPHWDRREILAKPYKFRTCSALAPM
jgi:hypothetical protein